jgi:hypothetical protein
VTFAPTSVPQALPRSDTPFEARIATSEFVVYLRLGIDHIADIRGYDHILFIAALTAVYSPAEWRRLLWLVTAFTLGHTVTLALATLDLVRVNSALVEVLIPVTIVLTSFVNILEWSRKPESLPAGLPAPKRSRSSPAKYALALFFGLIHGLGFSTFLRAMLGGEEGIALPLFGFNVGLEIGQLLIVCSVLLVSYFLVRVTRLAHRDWVFVLSGATAGIALTMIVDRLVDF